MSIPLVSVVIVTWNGRALLERFLPSVLATDYPALQVIVADNASEDGTAAWLAAEHPAVEVVRHEENGLFCRGNNLALPHARGEYVVLLNNDVEVPPGWLRPLVAAAEADPRVGAVQPKLLQLDRRTFEYAGASGGFLDAFGYPYTRGRLFFELEPDEGQYDDARDIFWATGAAILLRRSALDEVGPLDERFEMHMEEIDLCWRLWRAGWRVRVEPASTAYHLGGGSLPQGSPRKAYYNFRNSLLMLYKNLPPRAFRRALAGRLALDTLAFGRGLAGRNVAEARAITRAYRDFFRLRRHYTPPSEDGVRPSFGGSIAAQYFGRGVRRFRDLPASAQRATG